MKKLLCIMLALVLLLTFAACGADDGAGDGTGDGAGGSAASSSSNKETCKVMFSDAGMDDQTVDKGSTLQKPADPTKQNHIFAGWYVDAAFTTPATFPITVNANTTLYAKFYSYQEAFAGARNKTIGSAVPGYEYDYTLEARATYGTVSVALTGNTAGNAKYSTTGDVAFYDEHTNSGLLFYDGSEYQIRRETTLQKISLDEDGLLRKYEVEEVDADYTFDASSFAKALFTYDDAQLKSIEKTNNPNEYKLNTSFNASAGIAMASKVLNNGTVRNILSALPDNSVSTGMYVTFTDGGIATYRYEMHVSVTSINFSLVYNLTFKNVGTAQTISPRTFAGISLTSAEIAAAKAEVTGYVNTFAAAESSGYDLNVHTGVNFPSKNEIGATFQGSAKRKVIADTVYFHNDIEIDSDYKNNDVYKDAGIDDVHIKRTRLAGGDVYNIEKKVLKDTVTQVTPYTANRTDSYYLFDIFGQVQNYTFVQKLTDNTTVTYAIGVSGADVARILTYLNGELDLDPLGKATAATSVFGSFAENSVTPDEVALTVVVKNGALYSIAVQSDGVYRTALANSRDFTATQEADYSFKVTLTVRADGDTFTPYETANSAK